MINRDQISSEELKIESSLCASSVNELVHDFLSELLFQMTIDPYIAIQRIEITHLDGQRIDFIR